MLTKIVVVYNTTIEVSTDAPHIDSLRELGLTGLEAEAYAWLLTASPATGYGVAKGLGKPTANTYKALESLREKGAVVTDDDETRSYRAVPPPELLAALERRFLESPAARRRCAGPARNPPYRRAGLSAVHH